MFATGVSMSADSASRNDDNWVAEAIDNKPTDEAVGWLSDNTGRMFGNTGHDTSIKLIDDLLAAGCSKAGCLAIKGQGQTSHMWVKLPRDKAKRQEAFDIYNEYAAKHKLQKKNDGGQTYLLMEENMFGAARVGDHPDTDAMVAGVGVKRFCVRREFEDVGLRTSRLPLMHTKHSVPRGYRLCCSTWSPTGRIVDLVHTSIKRIRRAIPVRQFLRAGRHVMADERAAEAVLARVRV